jgi:hypothetical protein
MNKLFPITALLILFSMSPANAKEFINHTNMMNHGDGHMMDMDGAMVMGNNPDTLPGGCDKIAASKEITVHAGHKYAKKFPGRIFAFDEQEWQFEPCTKLTVHFINDDEIRHQWMMHGLPKYLYPKGMFHLEVTGPGEVSGTLIFPPNDKTYLVHCDISQHMEKGMKAQIKIGKGSGDLPSIPGITPYVIQDDYSDSIPEINPNPDPAKAKKAMATANNGAGTNSSNDSWISGLTVIGLVIGLVLAPLLVKKFKGMTASEVIATIFEMVSQLVGFVFNLIAGIIKKLTGNKAIELPQDK